MVAAPGDRRARSPRHLLAALAALAALASPASRHETHLHQTLITPDSAPSSRLSARADAMSLLGLRTAFYPFMLYSILNCLLGKHWYV